MKKHVMSITYEPKIQPVQDGECLQTIRKGWNVSVGDSILFHGWAGRPYRSPWSWRLRVEVQHIQNISIDARGIHRASHAIPLRWGSVSVAEIAQNDFIEPATGIALKEVLFGLNGIPSEPEPYQIIGW
jgi:hypothetical protein